VEKNKNIYLSLVDITRNYLGPASGRFIDRQIKNHLLKEPVDITKKDVAQLIDWLRSSVSLLTDNESLVEEYTDQLRELSGSKVASKRRFNDGKD
jgi:hypothetical protein